MDEETASKLVRQLEANQRTFVEQLREEREASIKRLDDGRAAWLGEMRQLREAMVGHRHAEAGIAPLSKQVTFAEGILLSILLHC